MLNTADEHLLVEARSPDDNAGRAPPGHRMWGVPALGRWPATHGHESLVTLTAAGHTTVVTPQVQPS